MPPLMVREKPIGFCHSPECRGRRVKFTRTSRPAEGLCGECGTTVKINASGNGPPRLTVVSFEPQHHHITRPKGGSRRAKIETVQPA